MAKGNLEETQEIGLMKGQDLKSVKRQSRKKTIFEEKRIKEDGIRIQRNKNRAKGLL